jgi:hypothetical protein
MVDKAVRKKSSKIWWVLTEKEGLLVKHYSGPDRSRAREAAAKLLSGEATKSNEVQKVIVARIASLKVLTDDSLKASLPKDAF